MRKSQTIQLRQSELRGRLNELLDKDELSDDEKAERDRLTAEFKDSEPQLRAALIVESGDDEKADADDDEKADVVDAVQLRDYFAAGMGGPLTGAARELNDELELGTPPSGGVWIPPEALMSDDLQERADTTTNAPTAVGGSQATILGRLFSDGDAAHLGCTFPTVPPGSATYPAITAGNVASARAKGASADAGAATIGAEALKPARIETRYVVNQESLFELAGMQVALAADLRSATRDKLDALVINGQSASPAIDGLLEALPNPTNPTTTISTIPHVAALLTGILNGKAAKASSDIRMLCAGDMFAVLLGISQGGRTAIEYLTNITGGVRLSAHVASKSGNIATYFLYGTRGGSGRLVAPIWNGGAMQLIVDPYSGHKSGQVAIQGNLYANVDVADSNAYFRGEAKIS